MSDKTIVVFRRYPEGDILALFPAELANYQGDCACYQHIGQHSAANYHVCIVGTKPATSEQYAPLRRELESIGYVLDIRTRYTRKRGN